ncbi:MAG TPA: hypothetical protein VFO12_01785 [Sphingomicrobium sp.]|nr:hypothetical protein [Sphingomicrobium sp.]
MRGMATSIHIDISVFTEDEAVGMISGEIEVPMVPQIGDVVTFDLQGADVVRHKAAFGIGPIKATGRLIGTGAEAVITIMLSDITAKTKDDALEVMAFFEDCHRLFGDRWDEQGGQGEAKE